MAYTPMTRDQYINQYKDYNKQAYQNQYNSQLNALKNQYEQNRLSFDQSKTNYQNSYTQGLNRLNELRNTAQADYTSGANKINEQRAAQTPLYQQGRNTASVNAAQSARRLSELMAAKGLSRGGSFMSGMAGVQNQRAAEIGDINQQEALFNAQLANRLAELEQARANSLGAIGNRTAELEQTYQGDLSNLEKQRLLYEQQYAGNQRTLADLLAGQVTAAELQAPLMYEEYLNQQRANDLALQNSLFQFLINSGQLTGEFKAPTGFKVNDYLAELYNRRY